jgi:hypothetical protein
MLTENDHERFEGNQARWKDLRAWCEFDGRDQEAIKPARRQEGRKERQVTYAWERWPDIVGEALPLLRYYWNHGGVLFAKELPMEPDYQAADFLDRYSRLKIYTVRANGSLIGLNSFNVGGTMWRKNAMIANGMILYLLPSQRRGGLIPPGVKIITGAEDGLREMGCHLICYLPSSDVDISHLLLRLGYVQQGSSFEKLLRPQ